MNEMTKEILQVLRKYIVTSKMQLSTKQRYFLSKVAEQILDAPRN